MSYLPLRISLVKEISTKSKVFKLELDLHTGQLRPSPSFYSIAGLDAKSNAGEKTLFDAVHADDLEHLKATFEAVQQSKKSASLDFRIIDSLGTHIYLTAEVSLETHRQMEEPMLSLFAIVNNEQVRVQKRIREMEDLLEMKDQAISMIAHDLRNPIAQLDGILKMLLHETENSEAKDLINMGSDSVNHAYEILRDLNEATRNKVEGKSISLSPTDLNAMLNKCAEAFKLSLESKGLHLSVKATKDLYVSINEQKMIRAIENLISNAIKFSSEGKSIELIAWEEKDRYCIAVQDSGIGMPEHIRKSIFNGISKSVRRNGTAGENSVGIGLSIVKGVVDIHHGRIVVESKEGEGSKFTICLPK